MIDKCNETTMPGEKDKITLIIGKSPYPKKDNLPAKGLKFYDECGASEVAFLTTRKNLNLVSIIGIILGSVDKATELIKKIANEDMMLKFAKFLHNNNFYLINKSDKKALSKIFYNWKGKCRILCVGCKKDDYKFVAKANKNKNILIVPHSSSQTYGIKEKECYETYFEHSYSGAKGSDLTLKDFKIKF